ncbi:hypothetical protein Acr_00g0040600 [Actinidia rufa]|uniref:Uncharacterized protein n=1 Tax=Actinidia rufa TaxID=165716 RepID=A0A7J0DHW3_9ERIC|nr:hypothetical protein Acr_00g0040600 [Actinidia rufa]
MFGRPISTSPSSSSSIFGKPISTSLSSSSSTSNFSTLSSPLSSPLFSSSPSFTLSSSPFDFRSSSSNPSFASSSPIGFGSTNSTSFGSIPTTSLFGPANSSSVPTHFGSFQGLSTGANAFQCSSNPFIISSSPLSVASSSSPAFSTKPPPATSVNFTFAPKKTGLAGTPQSTAAAPLTGFPSPADGIEEEVKPVVGQGNGGLVKQIIVSVADQETVVPGLRTDQDEIVNVVKMEVSSVPESAASTVVSATSFVSVEVATNPSVMSMSKLLPAEDIVVTTTAPKAETDGAGSARVTFPGNEVECISDVISTVNAEVESSARGVSQTFCVSAPFIDVNGYCISVRNGLIVKQIFDKYGDITKGSRIKSIAAKSGFLELVADAVRRLCNRTIKTLGSDELRLIEQHTADAFSVGFHVNWLQQRIEKISPASEYYIGLMELDQLSKQIEEAKKFLLELEMRQMICKQEVAALKDKMEENGFGESNLGEGLL